MADSVRESCAAALGRCRHCSVQDWQTERQKICSHYPSIRKAKRTKEKQLASQISLLLSHFFYRIAILWRSS